MSKTKNKYKKVNAMINALLEKTPKEELFTALLIATAFGKKLTRDEMHGIFYRLYNADEKLVEALFKVAKSTVVLATKAHGN